LGLHLLPVLLIFKGNRDKITRREAGAAVRNNREVLEEPDICYGDHFCSLFFFLRSRRAFAGATRKEKGAYDEISDGLLESS